MELLECPVRTYAWGSRTRIAELQCRPTPTAEPEAEMWVGAHPADPATVAGVPLTERIAADPPRVLGRAVVERFGERLPYLVKLLAAERPLSLQAHPDAAQAAAGFAAEEAAGVPRSAPHRRYVDPYHKPELLVAVSPFRALYGFRHPRESARRLEGLGVPELRPVVAALDDGDLADAVVRLLDSPGELVDAAAEAAAHTEGYALVTELARAYPGDPGVLVALLLHEVALAPGQAVFVPAGHLHLYLGGTAVEVMAASDNVLRGGLTSKHVDVAELLKVVRFEPVDEPVRRPEPVAPGVVSWPVPVAEFAVQRVTVGDGLPSVEVAAPGPRTALCVAGTVTVDDGSGGVTLTGGRAAFGAAEAGSGRLRVSGAGEVYLVTVPVAA